MTELAVLLARISLPGVLLTAIDETKFEASFNGRILGGTVVVGTRTLAPADVVIGRVAAEALQLSLALMEHEVEELMRVDGTKVLDPHAEAGPLYAVTVRRAS